MRPIAQSATVNNYNGAESLVHAYRARELPVDREYLSCTALLPFSNPLTGGGGTRYVRELPLDHLDASEADRLLDYLDGLKADFAKRLKRA